MKSKQIIDIWTQALDLGGSLVGSTAALRLRGAARTLNSRGAPSATAGRTHGASAAHIGNHAPVHAPRRGLRGASVAHPGAPSGASAAFGPISVGQKRKIQALLDFTPQSNLFSKARYPRIARNRWVESAVEQFPSVHLVGYRMQAIDDDRAFNAKLQSLKDELDSKVRDLRTAVQGKLKVEVRAVGSLGSSRLMVKSLDGKTIIKPDGNTLRERGIRGGGMELRRALEIADSVKRMHKQCITLSKDIARAHHDLSHVVGKHRRRGSTELIFTDKVFSQIKALRVLPVAEAAHGAFCPTPFLQMECFRMHSTLMARAIAAHLTLINRLYNRRTNLKRRALGTTRPAAFGLATGRFTYYALPLLEWRLSMRLQDGRHIMRDSVQRTSFSRVRGRVLRDQTEAVATSDGSLSMPAVAYASLLHMADEYHAVEAARFAFTRVVSAVITSARSFMSSRSNGAVHKGEWAFTDHVITPQQLQISTDVFA